MNIGQKVRFFREKAGYTQNALAQQLNVSPQAVSKWETNASMPDITLLPALADVLQISCDALLTDDGQDRTEAIREILGRSYAMDREMEGSYDAAVRELEEGIKRYPRSCALLLRLGEVYSYEGRYTDKAIVCLERMRTLEATPAECYAAVQLLCYLYGQAVPEKTIALAQSMPEIYQTRLALLYHGYDGEEKRKRMGAYFHALLDTAETMFGLSADGASVKDHFEAIRRAYDRGE